MNEPDRSGEAVLVPAGTTSASCQSIRSLGRRGIGTIVASAEDSRPEFASQYCDGVVSVPSPSDDFPAYKDALVEIAARPHVTTVIPCREVDAYLLSAHREEFTDHVSLVVPPVDVLESAHDRQQLVEAAEAAGVPAPETRLLGEVTDWSRPMLLKSRYNLLTDRYVDSRSATEPEEVNRVSHLEPGERPDCEAIRSEMKHDPIVQEFVPNGGKYMFAGLYDHGEPLSTFQHRQIRGNSYIGGGGVYRKSVYIEELESVARRLLDQLDWHGLACIEYIRDAETGEFKLLEINPRMWQSLPSTVRAGADFPSHYWLEATGRTGQIDPDYDLGVGSHMLYGEVKYLVSLLRDDSPYVERPPIHSEVKDVATSCVAEPHFDYLCRDDPRPFLEGLREFLSSG